jgi:uncharacterized membrane protein/mono/diheme cytochrome c family protein/YHS domain-containing protein
VSEQWLGFLGRFHPALVHLPIGLIILLAVLEILTYSKRFRTATAGSGYVLAIAVPTALASAIAGWLLAASGGYEGDTLEWHRWSGVATTVLVTIAAVLYRVNLLKAYRVTLAATLVALALAGHNGGSLTHGAGYLLEYAPAWMQRIFGHAGEPAAVASPEAEAFATLIHPMLNQHCVNCHGPEKSKGSLRLDSYASILKGGKAGAGVVPGKPDQSEILKRIHLPIEDEDHMPPDGKPQLSPAQIRILEWWVANGAPEREKVKNLPALAEVTAELQRLGGAKAGSSPATAAVPPLSTNFFQVIDELGVAASALGQNEPWVQVNASVAGTNFGDAQLEKLLPFAANVRWLDLAGTAITDAGIHHLAAMQNLTRVYLQRTAITDASLTELGKLSQLEYLNLYGTPVTDEGLAALKSLPQLRQLYLWQTKISSTAATAFAQSKIDRNQLRAWEAEIAALQAKIRAQAVRVDIGMPLTNAPGGASTNAVATAAICPVSGKPAKPDITVVHEGRTIAFCCQDCKATFIKEPAKYAKK